jgi:hypothetical protein
LQPAHYLPTTNYSAAPPGAVNVTPALVNFNPNQAPAGFQAGNVPIDWQNMIASNPDYMQWAAQASQRADTATAARQAAMRQLAIRFGGLPANFSDVYGDINQETKDLAAGNPESENARLLRSYNDQIESNRRQLAARGMLQSGEFDYTQGQLDLARQGDIYNLNNEFLNAAQGNINDYAGLIQGLNSEQIDQIRAAAMAVYNAGYRGGGGPTRDPRDPRTTGTDGVHDVAPDAWRTPDGRTWSADPLTGNAVPITSTGQTITNPAAQPPALGQAGEQGQTGIWIDPNTGASYANFAPGRIQVY